LYRCPCQAFRLGKPVRGLELHVLDVGQGLSAVLFTRNHTVLFDTGKSLSANASMVDRVIQPFLVSQGRAKVDVSIVSHGDDDHAGGLDTLLDLYPGTLLYSGDNKQSEQLLVDRIGQVFPVTVMVAPHHGSSSSSTPEFVSLLPPEYVIYAAGERNAFGFPHPEVVSRYERAGAKAFTTGNGGAVSMKFSQSGLSAPVDQYCFHIARRLAHSGRTFAELQIEVL